MHKEDQDSWQPVADKLEGLELLPDEAPLDRSAAWENIQGKLYPSKKRSLLWWAAAVLFLLGAGSVGLMRFSRRYEVAATKNKPLPTNTQPGKSGSIPGKPVPGIAEAKHFSSGRTIAAAAPAREEKQFFPRRHRSMPRPGDSRETQIDESGNLPANDKAVRDTSKTRGAETGSAVARERPDSASRVAVLTHKPLRVVFLGELEAPETRDNSLDKGLLTAHHRIPLRWSEATGRTPKRTSPISTQTSLFSINLNASE